MSHKRWLFVLISACVPATCQANLIQNGSFEVGMNPGGVLSSGSTAIESWLVVGDPNATIDYVVQQLWPASHGERSLDLNGSFTPGGIAQTFSTMSGATYDVQFDMSGNPFGTVVKHLRVTAANQHGDFAYDVTGNSLSNMNWRTLQWQFTADSPTTVLEFRSLMMAPETFGPALDNVRVSLVPEPAMSVSTCFLALLLGCMGTSRCIVRGGTALRRDRRGIERATCRLAQLAMVVCGTSSLFTSVNSASAQSLLFRESDSPFVDPRLWLFDIPGFDHVGFKFGSGPASIYESHPGYLYGLPRAWDPDRLQYIPVPQDNGVQAYHTAGSFRWNNGDPGFTTTIEPNGFAEVPLDPSDAFLMWEEAIVLLNSPFPGPDPLLFTSANQKGALGTYTCVGFVEAIAERAGVNCGEGFIPNLFEFVPLTPTTLKWAAETGIGADFCGSPRPWIVGGFDPVDFVLTDPLGRKLGHAAALGSFDEIPDAHYSGDGDQEGFALVNALAGTYTLEMVGLGDYATVDIRGANGSLYSFSGHLTLGEIRTVTFSFVPEPKATCMLVSIAAACLLGGQGRLSGCHRRRTRRP